MFSYCLDLNVHFIIAPDAPHAAAVRLPAMPSAGLPDGRQVNRQARA